MQDTSVPQLIINKLTREQYESIQNPSDTELYLITDEEESGQGGAPRNIGEIVSSTLPLIDAGLHLLDGSLIPRGVYADFVDYIEELYDENYLYCYKYQDNKIYTKGTELDSTTELYNEDGSTYTGTNFAVVESSVYEIQYNGNTCTRSTTDDKQIKKYFITEEEWIESVTNYGVCGRFVFDKTNKTVRLPKLTGLIEGTETESKLGELNTYSYATGTNDKKSVNYYYYIVLALSDKTNIQVNIDNVVTDLNQLRSSITEIAEDLEAEVLPLVSTQKIKTISTGTINLSNNESIYKITPTAATTFVFDTSNLSIPESSSYTFEVSIDLSTLYTLTFPNTVTWQGGEVPDLSETGMYLLVFRTMDGGSSWIGNLQGVW